MNRRSLLQLIAVSFITPVPEVAKANARVQSIADAYREAYVETSLKLAGQPLDRAYQKAMHHALMAVSKQLTDLRQVYETQVICDDSNNPLSVLSTRVVAVNIAWKSVRGINEVHLYIGPNLK